MTFLRVILGQAGQGNFSFFILAVNCIQFLVCTVTLIVAIKALKEARKR